MTEMFFKIPDDSEVTAKLVESIPDSWSCLDGHLAAPVSALVAGTALASTGIVINRREPEVVGKTKDGGTRLHPDLAAFFVDQKLPGFIVLKESGFDRDAFALGQAKRIVAGFLRKGYRGWLTAYDRFHRDYKFENAARCEIEFSEWIGPTALGAEAGRQPARMKLIFEPRYGGTDVDIAPIVAACAALGLQQYEPRQPEQSDSTENR
jgi:hypothetical protein